MDWMDFLQWPAMAITVLAAWLVASRSEARRRHGFFAYVASNALWTAWGWHTSAWALVALQAALFAMNVRGVRKNADEDEEHKEDEGRRSAAREA